MACHIILKLGSMKREASGLVPEAVHSRACGLSVEEISEVSLPSDTSPALSWKWKTWILESYESAYGPESLLAHINDNPDLSSKERERLLKKEFARYGVKVKFVP